MMYAGKRGRGRTDGTEKVKNKKYVLKRLWDYLYFYRRKLIVALMLMITSNALSLVGPYLTGRAITAMEDGVDFSQVFFYAGLMVSFYLVSAGLLFLLTIQMVRVSKSVVYKMRQDLFDKLNRVPIAYFDQNQTGDIISKMSYDIDTVSTSLSNDIIGVITSIITVTISLVMMIIMSPVLVLVFLVTIPMSVLLTKTLSKIIKKKYRIRNQKLGELNGFAEEMITGQRTIQSYVQEESVLDRFDKLNEEVSKTSYDAGYYASTVGPSVNFISNLSVALVGVFGGILYFLSSITLGNLASFTLYSRRFSGPINHLSNIMAEVQRALAAAERVFTVLDHEDEPADRKHAIDTHDFKGSIEFHNVSFSYQPDIDILKNISFQTTPGEVVAIVGPTGGGKTTLVNLLMRFYDVNEGHIRIDGHDVRDYTRTSLRKAYSMVLQDTWIFHGTVHDNIAYGNGDVARLEVEEAAKAAHIHPFISRLPEGYDTILTDEGLNISKGQKQLLVIARAMLSHTKMLILDEATSNVDTHTEVLIQRAMLALMRNKTTFVIAHRLSTIQNADHILVIDHGEIVEQGSHTELLGQKGFYYELYQSQFT
jgi:ATP-binding cassette, subfamily B, multidrug efflux pump